MVLLSSSHELQQNEHSLQFQIKPPFYFISSFCSDLFFVQLREDSKMQD